MNEMAANAGMSVISDGMSFRQAFKDGCADVTKFVDSILD